MTNAKTAVQAAPAQFDSALLDQCQISRESHADRGDGKELTLLELCSWYAGEPHSDQPSSCCRIIAAYCRALVGILPAIERAKFRPFVPNLSRSCTDTLQEFKRRALTLAAGGCAFYELRRALFGERAPYDAGNLRWVETERECDDLYRRLPFGSAAKKSCVAGWRPAIAGIEEFVPYCLDSATASAQAARETLDSVAAWVHSNFGPVAGDSENDNRMSRFGVTAAAEAGASNLFDDPGHVKRLVASLGDVRRAARVAGDRLAELRAALEVIMLQKITGIALKVLARLLNSRAP